MLIPMHLCSTLLIWGLFTLILLSDRRSLRNRLGILHFFSHDI